jgi:hypothetical protein
MAQLLPEEPREFLDPESFEAQVREYVRIKATMKALDARTKELHTKLSEKIELEGYEDNEGNHVLDLTFDADGFVRLENQRRVSRKLDEDVATSIIDELGLGADIYETKVVINEDALMAAYYDKQITEEQLDIMFPAKVSWALWTKK